MVCRHSQPADAQTGKIRPLLAAMLLTLSGCAIAQPEQAADADGRPDLSADDPPTIETYHLPTMSGNPPSISDHIDPLVIAPSVDADLLFNRLLACYPSKSKWAIDVDLRASATSAGSVSELSGTELGSNYVAIVASLPLYSATEMDRKQKNEYDLRNDTAKRVSRFVAAIANRNHATRELALYRSLESRAAVRVKTGVTDAGEQVKYLEKVASSQDALIGANAEIMETRLALAGLCGKPHYPAMNTYLKALSVLPVRDE